jgi:hypothetical protein
MSKLSLFSVLTFFLLSSYSLSAQNFYKEKISRDNIFSIGVGPSFAYLDNGGPYRDPSFNIKPSVSISLIKRLTNRFDLRASGGIQWLESTRNANPTIQGIWFENRSSFSVKGPAYYFDVMPSVNLIAFGNHMNRSRFNLYGGFGLGVMHTNTKQSNSYSADAVVYDRQITTAYVPLRAGLSYTLGPYSDIAGEGTMFFTFSDDLDGNADFNRYGDHLAQAQIVYRRYFHSRTEK